MLDISGVQCLPGIAPERFGQHESVIDACCRNLDFHVLLHSMQRQDSAPDGPVIRPVRI